MVVTSHPESDHELHGFAVAVRAVADVAIVAGRECAAGVGSFVHCLQARWERIEREDEPRRVSLEVMIRGTCDRARLLDLVENFTVFSEHKAGLVKVMGQNHQFLVGEASVKRWETWQVQDQSSDELIRLKCQLAKAFTLSGATWKAEWRTSDLVRVSKSS